VCCSHNGDPIKESNATSRRHTHHFVEDSWQPGSHAPNLLTRSCLPAVDPRIRLGGGVVVDKEFHEDENRGRMVGGVYGSLNLGISETFEEVRAFLMGNAGTPWSLVLYRSTPRFCWDHYYANQHEEAAMDTIIYDVASEGFLVRYFHEDEGYNTVRMVEELDEVDDEVVKQLNYASLYRGGNRARLAGMAADIETLLPEPPDNALFDLMEKSIFLEP
jgi:hypothetical protein